MRIIPVQTPRSNLPSLENQEDNQKPVAKESQLAFVGSDKVVLSPEITATRQYTTLATSGQMENVDIDENRKAIIAKRVASGYYSQPEIEKQIADKIVRFPEQ